MRWYTLLSLSFIAATLLAGLRPAGGAVWYAQAVVTVGAVLGGMLVRERMRGARRLLPAVTAYREATNALRTGPLHIKAYLFVAATLPLYIACFTAWKIWIDGTFPFTWDARLAIWDRRLHGGHDPWRIIHPLFSVPALSQALTIAYAYGWTIAIHGVVAWSALTNRPRFLIAMVIAWPLCGIVMAAAMMSAGPAFYGFLVDRAPNPFADLTTYLHSIHSSADYWQRYLWEAYVTRTTENGSGLSAMPSMHLTIATLYTCAVWGEGRAWRVAATTFVAVMLVGSVHTGWHYALDGYVGIASALGIWWLAGRLT